MINWKEISLSGNDWHLTYSLPDEYNPTTDIIKRISAGEKYGPNWIMAKVPGDVQSDALDAGLIPDLNFGLNSMLGEWTYQRDWTYYSSFTVERPTGPNKSIILLFKGVDYSCHVFLNNTWLGHHKGAWTSFEFDVTDLLIFDRPNALVVVIEHAPDEQCQWGRSSKVKSLKARFAYGWDWSTRMVPLGIWKDVILKTRGLAYIDDFFVRHQIGSDFSEASIISQISVFSEKECTVTAKQSLLLDGMQITETTLLAELKNGMNLLQDKISITKPELWFPNGYGAHPVYRLVSILFDENENEIDRRTVKVGLRRVEWILNDGASSDAIPYRLKVNNKQIFIRGWNWSPVRQLYGRAHNDIYQRRLELAREANCTLLRVNGCGIVERQIFYDLCDEFGIMVWQDLMQSSAVIDNHPSNDPFYIDMLLEQVEQIIMQKRNHPSIIIWCGGNELCVRGDTIDIYGHILQPELVGIEGYASDVSNSPWRPLHDDYPAISALKKCVKQLDPDRKWLPTTGSGPVENALLSEIGNMHDVHGPWIYLGTHKHYEFYNNVDMMLHSEFGCDGATSVNAINKFVPNNYKWPMDGTNSVVWHHGRMWSNSNLQRTEEVFGKINDLKTYVRASQFIQAEGLKYAMESHRRRKWLTSGALAWHMCEPWPNVCDTCSVDYYNQPKPAYYAMARANRMVHVSIRYDTLVWTDKSCFSAEIWGHNSTSSLLSGLLINEIWSMTGKKIYSNISSVDIDPECSVKWDEILIDRRLLPDQIFLLRSILTTKNGEEISHNWSIHSNTKTMDLTGLRDLQNASVDVISKNDYIKITNTSPRVIAGLWMESLECENILISDNWVCLVPGETRKFSIKGKWSKLDLSAWNLKYIIIECF